MGITITGHKDGLMDGLANRQQFWGAVSIVALLGFSTPFTEIMAGLSWLKIPKGIIEISLFAYRYIFVLLEDAMVIYNAQKTVLVIPILSGDYAYSNLDRLTDTQGV